MKSADQDRRVLFVGFSLVLRNAQARISALTVQQDLAVGILAPTHWKNPAWSHEWVLERGLKSIKLYASRTWLSRSRGGLYVYPLHTLINAIRDFRPHLVQIEQEVFSLSTFECVAIARLFGIPAVIYCAETEDRPLSWLRRWILNFVLRNTALILGFDDNAVALVAKWGYQGPIDILPSAVDTDAFAPINRCNARSGFTIGYVGRLVSEKGVDILLEAMCETEKLSSDCSLIICGEGPQESDLRRKAERLGIGDRVEWIRAVPRSRVPDVMARLDALVLPSRTTGRWREQFGLVLIQAMAMGIPSVGSDSGSIPRVIGRADLIFPEGRADALSTILAKLVSDPLWWSSISDYCLVRARTNYSNQAWASRLEAIWESYLPAMSRKQQSGQQRGQI